MGTCPCGTKPCRPGSRQGARTSTNGSASITGTTPVAPATSGQVPSAPGEASGRIPGSQAAPASEAAPTQAVPCAWSCLAGKAPASAAAPASSAAAAASSATAPTDPAADYSYSDDDWGPPRDEDAPPLDEEPPMDWEPSAPSGFTAMPTAGPAPSPRQPRQSAHRPPLRHALLPRRTAQSRPPLPPRASAPPKHLRRKQLRRASEDPWSRAVEHAPGSWVVGTESNVGSAASGTSADPDGQATSSAPATPSPVYEPAAAQIPNQPQASAPAQAAATAPAADWSTTGRRPSPLPPVPHRTGATPAAAPPAGTPPATATPPRRTARPAVALAQALRLPLPQPLPQSRRLREPGSRASTNGFRTAPKPWPAARKHRHGPPSRPAAWWKTSRVPTTKPSRSRESLDGPPSSVFWAESYWKNGRWTACAANKRTPSPTPCAGPHGVRPGNLMEPCREPAGARKGATKPRRPPNSDGVHTERTRTLCTKAQYKS